VLLAELERQHHIAHSSTVSNAIGTLQFDSML
jgi:hypothetical protein